MQNICRVTKSVVLLYQQKALHNNKIKIHNTMLELQAQQQQRLAQAIADRMKEVLTYDEAKKHYASFANESDAQDWLMKTAIVTLVVPISERQVQ